MRARHRHGAATLREVREQGLEELFVDFLEHVRGGHSPSPTPTAAALRQALADLDAGQREAR